MIWLVGSVGSTFSDIATAAEGMTHSLSRLRWDQMAIALGLFGLYLVMRGLASFNALRAAYPDARFPFRRVWGAYVAAYGLNGVVPAGSGSIVQLVLTKISIADSTYPAVTAALSVGALFDGVVCTGVMGYAFTQGVFPKPSAFGGLSSFDLAFFGRHPELTVFAVTALAVACLVTVAVLSRRIARFWAEVRQGLAILGDRRRYAVQMCLPQAAGWVLRGAAYYYLLEAFNIGGSVRGAVLVLAAQFLAAIVPFTPGGVGVQQALLVVIFNSTGKTDSVAVFSVGQQIVITAFTLALGFIALVAIFRYRGFRHALRDARAQRAADGDAPSAEAENEPAPGRVPA